MDIKIPLHLSIMKCLVTSFHQIHIKNVHKDPLILSPLNKINLNKGSPKSKRGGIRFSAYSNILYENQNQLLEALKKKDLNKIMQGFLFF